MQWKLNIVCVVCRWLCEICTLTAGVDFFFNLLQCECVFHLHQKVSGWCVQLCKCLIQLLSSVLASSALLNLFQMLIARFCLSEQDINWKETMQCFTWTHPLMQSLRTIEKTDCPRLEKVRLHFRWLKPDMMYEQLLHKTPWWLRFSFVPLLHSLSPRMQQCGWWPGYTLFTNVLKHHFGDCRLYHMCLILILRLSKVNINGSQSPSCL